jgi:hypothetical protein
VHALALTEEDLALRRSITGGAPAREIAVGGSTAGVEGADRHFS